jgi:SAM-dependent methyltransferase
MANSHQQSTYTCPLCGLQQANPVGAHIRQQHGEEAFVQAVVAAKRAGMSDAQIGEQFGITFKQLERIITQAVGVNVSTLSPSKRIKSWEPTDFRLENTTVWSFKQRGNWATHDGRYRGNWSPYIPRNLILRYTKPGDLVLDPFVGGGTTAVEAKLLGRRCIAWDINPASVEMTLGNLRFNLPRTLFEESDIYEPEVSIGDARHLEGIADNSVDLICAHPPYAGIISYTSGVEGDLSQLDVPEFLREMRQVALECYRVLKPGSKCAVLIGDARQRKHVIPIGFHTIGVFLEAGFHLKELVIKRQHNCRTTGFWADRSLEHNFLLLAHEYLPIFEKPTGASSYRTPLLSSAIVELPDTLKGKVSEPETTTVWVFPCEDLEQKMYANLYRRYSDWVCDPRVCDPLTLIRVTVTQPLTQDHHVDIQTSLQQALPQARQGGFVILEVRDVRFDGYVLPLAKMTIDTLQGMPHGHSPNGHSPKLWLKEIIVVLPDYLPTSSNTEELQIVHQYLLVYEVTS